MDATRPGEPPPTTTLASLFAAHHVRLVRVAWLLVRDVGVAEELVQDAFVDLHSRWARLKRPEDAAGYLHVSVVNRCRSALRHQNVVRSAPAKRWEDADSAEDQALLSLERRRVLDGLAELSQRQREVLVLRYYAQLSEAETAAALQISRGAVKSHGARGVHALRHVLGVPDEA
ncbi:SigE family RNA polymerase sigma factor [Microlunatus sagamiharensis]|uniref:SigE family RNA polymerase sigma factor n=1 Tax=Microlunatus sagamiharensis TaxID=546874 RepID=UPI000B8095FD|nr:SigE family RNA polymerase sigma factor [Microlunatus sagamiharensis]